MIVLEQTNRAATKGASPQARSRRDEEQALLRLLSDSGD
jgi:hypothetical protein